MFAQGDGSCGRDPFATQPYEFYICDIFLYIHIPKWILFRRFYETVDRFINIKAMLLNMTRKWKKTFFKN